MKAPRADCPDAGSGGPLVSALMVTFGAPERLALQRLSIADYCRQSWPRRELIIIANGGDRDCREALAAHVVALRRPDIRLIDVDGQFAVGALRNMSVDAARGEVVCQWDDDDRYHPHRIALQLDALLAAGGRAVLLRDVMLYFPAERLIHWTNWHATEAMGFPGSLMCCKASPPRYQPVGKDAQLGEDVFVVRQLRAADGVQVLPEAAHLYVYVAHGTNSWPGSHHRMLAERLGVSRGMLLRREATLREGLRAFDFGPEPVTVQGYNGPAFTLAPA